MNINLHIERLVLDGVDVAPDQRDLLQSTVTSELKRMFTDGGLSSSLALGTALHSVSTSGIQLNEVNTPTQLGHQIAQSVYGGIAHE